MMSPAEKPQELIDDQDFARARIRLRFRDGRVEDEFLHDTLVSSVNFIRAYLIGAILLYALFGVLDSVVGGSAFGQMMIIRYGIATPVLMAVLALTFFPIFVRVAQAALAIAMLVTGLGVVAMTAIMGPPFNSQYYAGIVMVVIYGGSLIRLKFNYSVLISLFLFLAYQYVVFFINPIPAQAHISNTFFLAMASMVGLFSSYIQELYIRIAYVRRKEVEAKNRLAARLLAAATEANKSKSEFLANMSHELRTPLNAIIGFSDIIKRQLFGSLGNEKYADYARDIHESGSRLLSIINDILDLAKAESGKLQINEVEFDLSETLESCVRMCRGRAESGGVELLFFGGQHEIRIVADERLVFQIVVNLVTNSIKFTPSGGVVRIFVTASAESGITIKVSDTGIGIRPEDIERVQRPFEQVETSYARQQSGTGLGLPYAKRLTELHGGTLTLESEVGKGTTVTVSMPPSRFISIKNRAPIKEAV